jgi:hypothetical protein
MTDLAHVSRRRGPTTAIIFILIAILLVLPVALFAIAQGLGLVQLPYELVLVLRKLPIAFPLHMSASGLALILIPIAAFARRWRGVHRAAGRLAAICVAVGGITALMVALASEATVTARAGFFAQGAIWLALLAMAVVAIRGGNVAQHARLMLAMAAVASGAIWLRLVIAVANAVALPFDTVYGVAAWACWLVPLAVVLGLFAQQKSRGQRPRL